MGHFCNKLGSKMVLYMPTKDEQKQIIDSCRALLLLFHPEAIKEMVPTDDLLENWPV